MIRFILLLSALLFNQAVHASDEKLLRHLKTTLWSQAYRNQDTQLLDQILHSSFKMIDANGGKSTKAKELDYIRNNHWNPSNFTYTVERLDIYRDSFAIIDGTGNTDTYSYKSSNVLIKEDGRWQAISSHVSGYKTKKNLREK